MENEPFGEFEIFPWNENFETGIIEIDEQHKSIVILLNKLAYNLTQDEIIEFEDTFEELAQYASFHFNYEEKIWREYIDDKRLIDLHKDRHDSFLPIIKELRQKHKNKDIHELIEEIVLFLIRWLAFHIVDDDKRLALIINSLKEGKSLSEAIYITDEIMSGSLKKLIEAILSMYDELSIKAINLIKERTARIKAEKELIQINEKLKELSITDQLTKLYNRRYFDEMLERELAKAKRYKTHLGLILIDIDHFKSLNDTYGHAYGDTVLVNMANCLKETCKRPNDSIYRIGGEEFVILVTNEDEKNILSLCEIMKKNIINLKIKTENEVFEYLTVSGGIYSAIPNPKETKDSILKLADERLYKAKRTGRNRIISFD